MEELREAERVEIDTAIYILWGGEDSLRGGKITSLSKKGCFIQTRSEALSGQRIKIRIRLPTERWMMLEGEVRHVLRRVGFGVQFTALAEDDACMLDLLVDYYRDESEIISGLLCEDDDEAAKPRRDIPRIKGGRVLIGPL